MRRMHLLALAAATAALLVPVAPAAAQDRPMFELPALEVSVWRSELHQRAMALYPEPARWEEAARLHRRAAEALPHNDAGRYFGFDRAARLFYYAGKVGTARRAMERAAEVAVATGDVLTAAHAFVDAAFLAVAEGFAGRKREYVREARKLAASDLLTARERAGILARIDGTRGGPLAARLALGERFAPTALGLGH